MNTVKVNMCSMSKIIMHTTGTLDEGDETMDAPETTEYTDCTT